jgi:hypothetical protein
MLIRLSRVLKGLPLLLRPSDEEVSVGALKGATSERF